MILHTVIQWAKTPCAPSRNPIIRLVYAGNKLVLPLSPHLVLLQVVVVNNRYDALLLFPSQAVTLTMLKSVEMPRPVSDQLISERPPPLRPGSSRSSREPLRPIGASGGSGNSVAASSLHG
jgi:hypothetical protein